MDEKHLFYPLNVLEVTKICLNTYNNRELFVTLKFKFTETAILKILNVKLYKTHLLSRNYCKILTARVSRVSIKVRVKLLV